MDDEVILLISDRKNNMNGTATKNQKKNHFTLMLKSRKFNAKLMSAKIENIFVLSDLKDDQRFKIKRYDSICWDYQ